MKIQAVEPVRRTAVVPVSQERALSTGYVARWEPPRRVVLTWQIGADWKFDPELVTHVEVRFVAEGPDRTRVELEHRDLDRFGPEPRRSARCSSSRARGRRSSRASRILSRRTS
jgi:hypothetical protein